LDLADATAAAVAAVRWVEMPVANFMTDDLVDGAMMKARTTTTARRRDHSADLCNRDGKRAAPLTLS